MGGAEERGLDPTLVGLYHGRQLEGSRKGEQSQRPLLFLMCIQDMIG